MKQIILLILVFATFSSCSQNTKRGLEIFKNVDPYQVAGESKTINGNKGLDIRIDYKNVDKNSILRFSDIFDSISYLKLESTSESMIGSVNKISKSS